MRSVEEALAEALRQAAVFLQARRRQARPPAAGPASYQQNRASYRQMVAVTGMQVATLLHLWPAPSSEQPLLDVVTLHLARSTTNL